LAIFGPGEEIHFEFDSPPAARAGFNRRFVLEFTGWCKDNDLYTKDGQTLEPLPQHDGISAEQLLRRNQLHAAYNTRYRRGE
jgi:hypothetical protein